MERKQELSTLEYNQSECLHEGMLMVKRINIVKVNRYVLTLQGFIKYKVVLYNTLV